MTRLQTAAASQAFQASHCLLLRLAFLMLWLVVPFSLALSATTTKKTSSATSTTWGGMTLPSTILAPTFTTATHPQSVLLQQKQQQQQSPSANKQQQSSRNAAKNTNSNKNSNSNRRQFKNIDDLLDSFREEDEAVLIAFTAVNCGPCKLQKRELQEAQKRLVLLEETLFHNESDAAAPTIIASQQQHKRQRQRAASAFPRVLAIDTNKWPHVGSRFQVGKLPCLVAVKNGKILFRLEGLQSADNVVSRLLSSMSVTSSSSVEQAQE